MQASTSPDVPSFPYFQFFLSLRYLKSRFSALAALLSVAFGVVVILIVLSIMGGYMEQLRESIRGQESHLTILGARPFSVSRITRLQRLVENVDNVAATAPFVETLAMYRSSQFNPCRLKGILPRQEVRVSGIGKYVLRPEELEGLLRDLHVDQAVESDGAPGLPRSGLPAATREIDKVLNSPTRAPLSAEELERFFGPTGTGTEAPRKDFRWELLERKNPTIVPDLQGSAPPACLVGIHLLLDREMFLGEVVTIITLDPRTSQPIPKKFLVAGAFKTGDYNADSRTIYAHVDTLKNMLGLFDAATNSYKYEGLRVALKHLDRVLETRENVQGALGSTRWALLGQAEGQTLVCLRAPLACGGPLLSGAAIEALSSSFAAAIKAAIVVPEHSDLTIMTWEQRQHILLEAVRIEKFVIYFLVVLLIFFAACMVLLMLTLTVIEKTRDIGVLLALGATPFGVVRVFLTNGMILSVAGTILGLVAGYLFCTFINPIHDWIYAVTGRRFFPAEIYHMDRIPIAFQLSDVLLSIAPPLLLGFVASLIPAIWAARRDPIKAIHYE